MDVSPVNDRVSDWVAAARIRARRGGFLIADVIVVSLSLYIAYWLRFDGYIPANYLTTMLYSIPLAIGLKIPVFMVLRMYRFSWRHVGVREMLGAILACNIGTAVLAAAFFLLREFDVFASVPRSVLAIDFAFCLIGISGVRLSNRLVALFWGGGSGVGASSGRRALIVGAGDAGTSLARSLLEEERSPYTPVGFLDDDGRKRGLIIHGLRVIGGIRQLRMAAESLGVDAVLIAIPSTAGPFVRETVARAREAGIQDVRVLPPLSQLYSSQAHLRELREVTPEDLLRREPVSIDTTSIEQLVRGRSILITGAAGSIGSELCRQVVRFGAGRLTCLDIDETGLFHLEHDLGRHFPQRAVSYWIGDVRDQRRVREVLSKERPEIVFHAAAYKHVPIMERNPVEAVKTNVLGTHCVVEEACALGVSAFVMISTDKAVDPCSIMGATKRVAELITHACSRRNGARCMAVRFGNVLGSRGSVLPTFEEQIRRGGPVTITDPQMRRYFMVTSEAVLLVLQAAAMGRGGEVFVLDMGEPVSILELARDLIRSYGMEPDQDIPIVFTGARPGERLSEELLTAEEGTESTTHEKVFVARLGSQWDGEDLDSRLGRLRDVAEHGSREEIVNLLRELVPSYKPDPTWDGQ
jgi:FlaA1/EpsC-like NDP-sugar epimerase